MKNLLLLALLCPFLSMCQPLTIKGKIINESSEPIANATITLKRAPNLEPRTANLEQLVSNSNGEFSLTNIHYFDTLLITAVGYEAAKEVIDPTTRGQLTVVLKRKITALDDVVVIAYGTTTRRLNTGSITTVKAADIASQPVPNPIAALEGLVPGLLITQYNGLPGANLNVQLRGINSLKQGTQPLFIVDGVPFMLNGASVSQVNTGNNSIFNNINPADIESIEVLKDADATAIYGSQGANGVVLITTKKGKAGKPVLDLSYYTGRGKVTRFLPLLNTPEYLAMRKEAFANDGIVPTVSTAPDLLSWDSTAYTDWRKELIGGTARTQNMQASLSGGMGQSSFYLGAGYYSETTVFPLADPYQRASLRFSLDHAPRSQKLRVSFTSSFSTDKKALPLSDLTSYVFLPPNTPASFDSTGNLAWYSGFDNPYAYTRRIYKAGNTAWSANLGLQYTISRSITLKTSFGYNKVWNNETAAMPVKAQRPSATATGTAIVASGTASSLITEPYIEYKAGFGKHQLTVLAGASFQQRLGSGNSVTGSRYTSDDLLGTMAAAGQLAATNSASQYKYIGVFARLSWNLHQRYIINLNGRRDGSSRFGPASQFANFGSAGAGWVFSDEPFLKNKAFLSYGKMRLSLGVTGNDQIGDYQYLDSWSSVSYYGYNGASAGVLPGRLFNASYQWEKVTKTELGMDLAFFKNNLTLSLNAFRNRSSNQLVAYKLPVATGFASILKNLDALIQNSGFECELNAKIFDRNNTRLSLGFNLSVLRNKLLAYPGLESSSDKYSFALGKPLQAVYAYRYSGINPATGVYSFEDLNGDGVISVPDLQYTGSQVQDYFGGFTVKYAFGGFELTSLVQFVKQTGRSYLSTLPFIPGTMNNQPSFVLDRWTKPGSDAALQKYTATSSTDAYKAFNLYRSSSALLGDASYMRLRNLSLSYNLPLSLRQRLKASVARIYIEGQNLFTFTSYEGADPETQSLLWLPPLRMLAAGIQLTF